MFKLFLATFAALFAFTSDSFADDAGLTSHLGAVVGATAEVGSLADAGMGLQSRTMDAVNLEVLPGYRLGRTLLGVDFQYQWEGQWTSLSDSGGTNLKGEGYYFGLGANYSLNEHWAFQGAVDFLGLYHFHKQTTFSDDDHLARPLNFRGKAQYFFSNRLPLSANFTLQYLRFGGMKVASTQFNYPARQWMAGVGVSYHFGEKNDEN